VFLFLISQFVENRQKAGVIVGSLSGSRLKSVRFLVEESDALMTSDALAKIIKINH
jgi:hypothetical protein